jgi:uncharacterized protein YecE (DUF72 family)
MGDVRIGTCSWTDKTMLPVWYPPGVKTAEARLRYYAERFDTVEADSPFYAIPDARTTALWAERTPPDFVFHVKAFGMMTQHNVLEAALPPELKEFPHETDGRGRVSRPSADMVDGSFDMFLAAVEPLRAAGKLGGILMQYPPYFTAMDGERLRGNLEYLEYCRAKLGHDRMLVEFRHPSWVDGARLDSTLAFLAEHDMSYVSVDAPQFAERLTMPPIAATTVGPAYVRFHGRNRETYFKRTESAADRFDYLYTPEELVEWAEPVRELAAVADETYVMFNNCRYDYAPRNAAEMAEILSDLVRPLPDGELPGHHEDATLF